MEKEQKALKDFLGNLGGNTEEVGLDLGQETETLENNEDIPEVAIEEEIIPFHKMKEDPRFQRYVEKEVKKKMNDYKPTQAETFIKETKEDTSLVDAFEAIIGNDTPEKVNALKGLKNALSSMEERTKKAEEASEFVEQTRQQQLQERQAMEYLEDGLDRIEDNYEVDLSSGSALSKKTRNDFLDFLERISPKDENGDVKEYADIDFAYEEFNKRQKPETNSQAKQIASRGISRSSVDATNTPTKRITFENVREMMGLE